ncbi:MAG: hypothetical protein DI551_02410 [Micavibrio aeruginosavorus]|uniref:Uncharacterized protein n=1 Tax=Micavibrio aeruginosavorus TaxID=349221 RepID=A0A2W5N630_9BACT|nr:MAG: hypothetical protein DI551_02410 [Micavibrio aeruginosavorus]
MQRGREDARLFVQKALLASVPVQGAGIMEGLLHQGMGQGDALNDSRLRELIVRENAELLMGVSGNDPHFLFVFALAAGRVMLIHQYQDAVEQIYARHPAQAQAMDQPLCNFYGLLKRAEKAAVRLYLNGERHPVLHDLERGFQHYGGTSITGYGEAMPAILH